MVAYASFLTDARIKAYVRALTDAGASVDVFVARDAAANRSAPQCGATVVPLTSQYQGSNRIRYAWSYLKFLFVASWAVLLASLIRRYATVHVHNMPNVLVLAGLVPRLVGATVILDVHDLMPPNYLAKFPDTDDQAWVLRGLVLEQRLSAAVADRVICADDSQRDYLEHACRVPARKLHVVLNLPDERVFRRRHAQQEPAGPLRLVYHGTLAKRLGIDIMLRAMALLPSDVPATLFIYGNGDFLQSAVSLANDLGLSRRVWFSRSFFAVESVPGILGQMDVGLIGNRRTPACDKYMLPVKLLEYAYTGIPVIAPRLEIIARYFDESMVKFYEPEDVSGFAAAITDLYRRPGERVRLAANAARFFDTHSWSRQEAEYLALALGQSRGNETAGLLERCGRRSHHPEEVAND